MMKRWLIGPCAALALLAAWAGRSSAGSFFGPGPYGAPYLATHGGCCYAWGWGGCGGNCNNGRCGQGTPPGVPYGCSQPAPPVRPCNCGGFFGPPGAKFPYCPIWFPTWSDYAPKPMALIGPPLPIVIPGVPVPPAPAEKIVPPVQTKSPEETEE